MHESAEFSIAANRALRDFSEQTFGFNLEAVHEKGERIVSTLRLFVGNRLPEPAYDAARLMHLVRVVRNDKDVQRRATAAEALLDYLTNPDYKDQVTPEAVDYILDLCGDMEAVYKAALHHQDLIKQRNTVLGNQVWTSISAENDIPIPVEHWSEARAGVDVPKMREVVEDVNVEAILIGAAELLDTITYEKNPRRQMRYVLEAETFYCPALDALGMWAFESALRNAVNRVRLVNAGRRDLIEDAANVLNPIRQIGQEVVLEELFSVSIDDEKTRFHLDDETPYGTTTHFIDTNIDMVLQGVEDQDILADVRVISRLKGIESLAMKRFQKSEYAHTLPSDIVGMTAIVKGEAQLAALFSHMIQQVESLENCSFGVAASKNQALFIKGGEDFIASLRDKLPPELVERIEFKPNGKTTSAFQVAKMTLIITKDGVDIPVEIQFQTEKDRERAETGDAPHFMQKTEGISKDLPGNISGDPGDLARIRERKRRLLDLLKQIIAVGHNGPQFGDELYDTL